MQPVARKRGRPRKNPLPLVAPVKLTPQQMLEDLKFRFEMLHRLTQGSLQGTVRSLVVSGAPGVGKSHTVEMVLNQAPHHQVSIVKGALSAVELYKTAYLMSQPGGVVVLDDCDGIFHDEDALNLLKALCDSGHVRRVSWMKDSPGLREQAIPQSFDFHGSFIFISNLDFQARLDAGTGKMLPHFQALLSRSLYLDLQLHSRESIMVWVKHVVQISGMFRRENILPEQQVEIMHWVQTHQNDLRHFSLRTIVKLCQLVRSCPGAWKPMAQVLLCRS